MYSKIFKVVAIVVISVSVLIGIFGFWVYQNQEKIFIKVKTLANEKLDGNLEIRDYGFSPMQNGIGFTFSFYGVKLHDKHFNEHKTNLLEAGVINVTLNLWKLFSGQVEVRSLKITDGQMNAFVRKDGFSNLSIFSSKKTPSKNSSSASKSNFLGSIENVSFINFKVQYTDSLKEKSYGAMIHEMKNTIAQKDNILNLNLNGSVLFRGLIFNQEKGGFLINQETQLRMLVSYDTEKQQLLVKPSEIEVASGDKIGIWGTVDFLEKPGYLRLNFKTTEIVLNKALALLPRHLEKVIGRIGINPTVTAKVNLDGSLGARTPRVDISFKAHSFNYQFPIGMLKNLSADGTFTNQADKTKPVGDENSRITGMGIKGLFETIPIKGSLVINNLEKTMAVIEGSMRADKASINPLLDPKRYEMKDGVATINFTYKGSVTDTYDEGLKKLNGSLDGKIALQNLSLTYLPKKVTLSQLKGNVLFDEQEIKVPDVQFSDGKNKVFLNGKITGLFPYLYEDNALLKAVAFVKIPDWQLTWLEMLVNLKPSEAQKQKKSDFRLSTMLDKAIDDIQIEASLESKRLRYNKLVASNMKGKMTLNTKKVQVNNFSMNAFGGTMKLAGDITHIGGNKPPHVYISGTLTNTDVQSVFESFNNFGQTAITEKNIRGKLSSDFEFNAEINNDVSLVYSTMDGKLAIDLKNAEIINFGPFMKMKKLIFKNRAFEHVRFAPIVKNFTLKGKDIAVTPMQVESNVLTLFLEGTYSFGNATDLSIQVPLSNLKRRDSTYQFTESSPESFKSNIFLRAIEENGEVNIKYDPKKKSNKDKK